MNNATLKDLAALAGVSPATASRVLSGHPATSARARQAVEAAVRELDFVPNAQARALRSTRSDTIGLLVSDIRNPFFADLAHTIEQAALNLGYVTLLGNANENAQQHDRYINALISRQVDGIIVAPQGDSSDAIKSLTSRSIPTVFVDRIIPGVDVPSVTTDSDAGIRQAVSHLVGLGHDRIGYIAGPQTVSTGRDRLSSFTAALAANGLTVDPDLIFYGNFQAASGSAAVHALLSVPHPPTALFAADSLMAVGALAVVHRLGLQIGVDIAIVTFDDIEWFALLDPPLSVVSHSVEEMGRIAVELLVDVMNGGRPKSVCQTSELIIRGSSAHAILPRTAGLRGSN